MAKHDAVVAKQVPEQRHTRRGEDDGARARLLAPLPVTERRLSLNGVDTAVLEGGEGPPIVLLHGPGAYAAQWLRVIPDLVTTHRVVAPDLPGHGASETFAGSPGPEAVLGWLDDLIECTCAERPAFVGQTLGGAIAARFAAERGERLAALVLVDALGLASFAPDPEFGAALNEYLSAPTAETHDRLWSQCVFDVAALRRRLGEQWTHIKAYSLDRMRAPGRLDALRAFMQHFGVPAIPVETLAHIPVPTTLIWGRNDRAIPVAVAEDASRRLGWDLHVIEEAGNEPLIEQPEAFVKALRGALRRQVAR
jgi:pimeloyl-ACP methyl ester carboxylesterase